MHNVSNIKNSNWNCNHFATYFFKGRAREAKEVKKKNSFPNGQHSTAHALDHRSHSLLLEMNTRSLIRFNSNSIHCLAISRRNSTRHTHVLIRVRTFGYWASLSICNAQDVVDSVVAVAVSLVGRQGCAELRIHARFRIGAMCSAEGDSKDFW